MDIFRRLGSGISKLSLHKKKNSSKLRSTKGRRYEARSDGLTYNSPFGASFRHDPSDLTGIAFVSPETFVNRRSRMEDFDDLEGSDSSFDKPFLDQSSRDDLGDGGSERTRSKFRTSYWKPDHARRGSGPESKIQQEESSMAVVNGSESLDLEPLSRSRQSQTVDVVESHQSIKTSRQSSDLKLLNSTDRGIELGTKFQPLDASNWRSSDSKKRTNTGTNFLGANLDSLRLSIEGLIDSGLRFQSSYTVGFEPANEQTERSKSLNRYLRSESSTQNPTSAAYSRNLPEVDAWNIAHGDTYCGQKRVSAQCESLDSIHGLGEPDIPSDAEETDHSFSAVGKRGSVRRRRSSSLSKIDAYKKHISVPHSKRGSDLPATEEAVEVLPTKQGVPADQQELGSFQLNSGLVKSVRKLSEPTGKRPLGKRPSELRNRRLAVMLCPRPFGYRNTAHDNHSPFRYIRFSDRRSPDCSGEESEPIRSDSTRESELYTVNGLPDAGLEHSGDEFCKLSYSKSPRINSDAVNKQIIPVGLDKDESPASVISGRESSEEVVQPIQATRNLIQDCAQIKSLDVPQRICKTIAIEPCIATQTVMSEASLTLSSRGRDLERLSLSKSVHQNFPTQLQQTSRPGDIWWKYPDLEEIKSSEPDKMAFIQSLSSDDLFLQVPPSISSITMTNPHPPGRYPLQPRLSQASATPHENTINLELPFSFSNSIFCTKEAILRQSRKGWSNRSSSQDLD